MRHAAASVLALLESVRLDRILDRVELPFGPVWINWSLSGDVAVFETLFTHVCRSDFSPIRRKEQQPLSIFHAGLSNGGRADTCKVFWPLLQHSTASPLGSNVGPWPTRWQAGRQVSQWSEWKTCYRPTASINTWFSSSGVPGLIQYDV